MGCGSVMEPLSSMHKDLSSIPQHCKNKLKNKTHSVTEFPRRKSETQVVSPGFQWEPRLLELISSFPLKAPMHTFSRKNRNRVDWKVFCNSGVTY